MWGVWVSLPMFIENEICSLGRAATLAYGTNRCLFIPVLRAPWVRVGCRAQAHQHSGRTCKAPQITPSTYCSPK
jgi:hypothetical protein